MFGSRKTIGAIRMPATEPMAAAMPHPSATIQPTRMPDEPAEAGFSAAARMASPMRV